MDLDELTPVELVRLMNREDARVISAVGSQLEAIGQAVSVITECLRKGGRLVYAGAGTSGRLGTLDATECPPTFSSQPGQVVGIIAGGAEALTRAVEGAEDHSEFGERDLRGLDFSNRDVLVGIAASGRTPYVLGAVAHARREGAYTIGISCNADSDLRSAVDLAITAVVGPEVLTGSTRLKAGTATKLVLNMLSTGAMVGLGKTFGNLMVDLRATNSKLRARSNRILRTLTGLPREAAANLLRRCEGELKTALVVQLGAVGPEEARQRLAAAVGQVRPAVGARRPSAAPTPSGPVLYLGIDGGGSHTTALLALARPGGWSVLGRGTAGPSNLQAVGSASGLAAVDDAVARAFLAAGLSRRPVAAACIGMAGAGRPDEQGFLREWAVRVGLAVEVEVTTDAAILLAAGTPEGWGLAVIAGTGSMAYARSQDGRAARAGGWGPLLGDEGSGYALVTAGLRAVARAADGRGSATVLQDRLLARLGITRAIGLIPTVYGGTCDRAALAALAPVVLEAASEDAVAAEIVDRAARELADTAAAAVRQLGWAPGSLPVALAGGVLRASTAYRTRVLRALGSLGWVDSPGSLVDEPAEGALRLLRTLGPQAAAGTA
jgi:N-acetylmuramic acid 6-phosphate etherase